METRRDERIGQLLQALKRSDKLHLKEAATLLGVSEMTIRRDLNHKKRACRVARRLYRTGAPQRQSLSVKRSKISSGGRKTPSRSAGCGPGTSASDGIY